MEWDEVCSSSLLPFSGLEAIRHLASRAHAVLFFKYPLTINLSSDPDVAPGMRWQLRTHQEAKRWQEQQLLYNGEDSGICQKMGVRREWEKMVCVCEWVVVTWVCVGMFLAVRIGLVWCVDVAKIWFYSTISVVLSVRERARRETIYKERKRTGTMAFEWGSFHGC